MSTARRPSPRPVAMIGLAVLIVAHLAAASVAVLTRSIDGGPPQGPAVVAPPGPGASAGAGAEMEAATVLAATPVRVRIPAIEVDADLDSLGLDGDGSLEVPPYERAGWWAGGAKPGEDGPAVIAAHVDSTDGPAVFYRLDQLQAGDTVAVDYDDGTTVEFVVSGSESFAKTEFPTDDVYGDTEGPELRLITCGGSFDRRTRSYEDNLIVWAGPPAAPAATS